MGHSTRKRSVSKPAKPYADFPLFPHAAGRWAKKAEMQALEQDGLVVRGPGNAAFADLGPLPGGQPVGYASA